MELRFHTARATKDLDFTVRAKPAAVLEYIQDVGALDAGDFFSSRVGEAMMDLDGAPHGGARYPLETLLGGRTFVKFHLDGGVGDVIVEPVEFMRTRDWLGFAGVAPPDVPVIQREQQFAEKPHAYTLPRPAAPNSRVRDLVDLLLLIRSGTLHARRVVECLRRTFARRDTHPVPRTLEAPPACWTAPFAALAEQFALEVSITEAFADLTGYVDGLELHNRRGGVFQQPASLPSEPGGHPYVRGELSQTISIRGLPPHPGSPPKTWATPVPTKQSFTGSRSADESPRICQGHATLRPAFRGACVGSYKSFTRPDRSAG